MTLHLGSVPAGTTLYIPFASYDSNGASITLTGLAVTDIEIYKDGSTTQRSSDAGYTLLDTDGIDFDGITGLHGFSIDLNDNTDAGFFSAGAFYWVVVSAVTIDTRTVTFIAATFWIGPQQADVRQYGGTAGTFASGRPEVNTTHAAGTAWGSGAITAGAIATGAIDADALAADAVDEILDEVVEGSTTFRQLLRGFAAALLGKANGLDTNTPKYRDLADTKNRIDAVTDARGNRQSVTLDLT